MKRYCTMLCCVMLCCFVLCCAMLSCAMLCCAGGLRRQCDGVLLCRRSFWR